MTYELLKNAVGQLGVGDYSPGSSTHVGWIYNPIPFPGCDFPCHRSEGSLKKWRLIKNYLGDLKGKTVLDFGCATGFFSFQIMKEGAKVLGVEKDEKALKVCNVVLEMFKQEYRLDGRFDSKIGSTDSPYFDLILAMSVLNWLGKDKAEEALDIFSEIGKWLIVEMPLEGDGMQGASWLHTEDDCRSWLHRWYKEVTKLGMSEGPGGRDRALFFCV